jgi:N-acetylglucosaminyl-diphospho-decaprenol L-rhamnosyltransferase
MLADARGDGPAWGDGLRKDHRRMAVELSYCVASTEQRQLLRYCLDAIARERAAVPFATEVLVLDNASRDGSAEAARSHPATTEVIEVAQRRGRPANHTELLRRAAGRFCLLLNEDSELEPGATAALHAALADDGRAAAAGALLVDANGTPQPSAWRFPGVGTALLGVAGLHRRRVVQSRGERVRRVDWSPPSALLVRREAAEAVGWLDPGFHAAGDGADFARRLRVAGWHVLHVPEARAVCHEHPETASVAEPRLVEEARNYDRYMRKHHSATAAGLVRVLVAARFATRTVGALRVGGDPGREARYARAALFPNRGEGLARRDGTGCDGGGA